jgi:hypothetical protein
MTEIHITRISGFDRGKTTVFAESPVVLGTDATSSLRFDPTWDKTVSPRHARLEWRDHAWHLIDESREGCWIQGQRLAGPRKLNPSTEIELGRGGPKIRTTWSAPAQTAPQSMSPPPIPNVASQPSIPAAESPGSHKPDGPAPTRGLVRALGYGAAALLLVALIALAVTAYSRHAADEALAEVAAKLQQAVGLVVLSGPEGPMPFGTAWAIGDHVLATNSHVAEPVGQILANGGEVHVVLNGNPDKKFRVVQAVVHPLYESGQTNANGQETAVPAFDVGLLVVKETLPVAFKVAPESELKKLRSGSRVAYLGFPSEGLAGGGVDPENPVATMQSGIVTSVTDWWLGKADFEKALLVQHNLGATGGASGSPIFNPRGEVVALLSAGNIIGQVRVRSDGSVQVTRAPSAVMINFGQRADLLNEFMNRK